MTLIMYNAAIYTSVAEYSRVRYMEYSGMPLLRIFLFVTLTLHYSPFVESCVRTETSAASKKIVRNEKFNMLV